MVDNTKIHESELNIAKYFVEICEKNNLEYFILGGTFLGAVRHKGFIPWDDDMDFGMPRKDYEKLYKLLSEKKTDKYIYKNFKNSNIKTYFSRIEDPTISIIDTSAKKEDIRNAWIDIFPLDGMPNGKFRQSIHKLRILITRVRMQYSQFDEIVNQDLPGRRRHEQFLIDLGNLIQPQRFINKKKAFEKMDKLLKKYPYDKSKMVGNHMGIYKFKETFEKNIYEETDKYLFEDIYLTAPKNYDLVLKQLYGEYMIPPKVEERNKHHTKVIER